jgi:type IV secretory pathway TraG/TraD family ATPase VirD4
MRTNLDELLTEIVADAEELHMGVVLDKLKGFVGKDGNDSVADIETTLKTYLEVFSYPNVQWCVHDNPNKTSPAVLDDGKTNLDFAIPESMLGVYQPLFRLVSMQVLRHCESAFHESDDRYTMLLLDEAARIGRIEGLDSAFSTLRSKNVAIICLFQSISQFKDIYPSEKANRFLNLCELKIFLSGSGDENTTKYVSGMVGQFDAAKMSYKYGMFGKRDGNTFT